MLVDQLAQNSSPSKSSVLSAMLLVAGTCIGGGMIALPVAAGLAGFVPAIAILILCWAVMTMSALALLEVSLWMEEGAHIITMSKRMLGTTGKVISWILYLFICYASLVAYTAEGGAQIGQTIHSLFNTTLPKSINCTLFLGLFGSSIYLSSKLVGRVNSILFFGLILSYFAFIGVGFEHVNASFLSRFELTASWIAVPFLLTAFSFHTMVPSLTPILKHHGGSLRIAIIGGSTITFLVYLVWLWLVLGIIPAEGPYSLTEAFKAGSASLALEHHGAGKAISGILKYFSFFALVTSFLGIGLGLFDFLSDGLRIPKTPLGRVKLSFLIAIPILFFAINFERAFFIALDATGGYGDTILSGIIPLLMLWKGLYRDGKVCKSSIPWNRPFIIFLICIFTAALILELAMHTGLLTSMADTVNDN